MAEKKAPAMSPSDLSVAEVLERVQGPRRAEADELLRLFRDVSGKDPVVWAGRIIGFGEYEYRYKSGHGGVAPILAFASNSTKHTVYMGSGFEERYQGLLQQLGKHKASKACLYFSRLAALDKEVLRTLLELTLAETQTDAD